MEKRPTIIITTFFLAILTLIFTWQIARSQSLDDVCDWCWPHPSNWGEVEQHGLFTFNRFKDGLDSTMGAICQECHGSNLTGGSSGRSCYSCHQAFPHSEGWKEPANHGVYALNNGWEQNCKNACHGEDYRGGYAEKSCYDCHEVFPHPQDWADENRTTSNEFHGMYVLNNDAMNQKTCATQCHGKSYDGGLSNRSCFDCHEAFPHAFNWSRPNTHGIYAMTFGVEDSCAIGCHGKEYEGGNTEISCYDCHDNFPHPSGYETAHETMSPDEAYQCATLCHGANLAGGDSGVSCTVCHDNVAWPLFKLITPPFNWFFTN